ncbi:MAG: thioredoxin-disulfide reductase [Alistipes sp.]|nr:thioredoxin-disulfide reductase [Alistipes sp.]
MNTEHTSCLIIGSGPAGYTAAIYAARANLQPILYEGIEPGGQLTTTTRIENFPGFPAGIEGNELMERMKQQAEHFGTQVRFGTITAVESKQRPFQVTVDGNHLLTADTLIIATGATAKYLGLESESQFKGMGVSACATCDGFFYRNQVVAVVGGGDTACEEATYLASICKTVHLIVRKPHLRASKAMQKRVLSTPNLEVHFESVTQEIVGDASGVTGVRIRNEQGLEETLAITGFFVAIGHRPNTAAFADFLELNEEGYIRTSPGSTRTNIPGIFAAGDVQDPHVRQAITAAGSGCAAALECERYLLNLH